MVGRVVAVGAGVAHYLVPRMLNLSQDPAGPGLGPGLTQLAFTVMAVIAIAGALFSVRLPTVGAALVSVAAITSAFMTVWEYRPIVFLLSVPMIVAALLLLLDLGQPIREVQGRRAAMASVVIGGVLIWRMLKAYDDRFAPTHPDSTVSKPNWLAKWMWVGGVSAEAAKIAAAGLPSGSYRLSHWSENTPVRTVTADAGSLGLVRFELTRLEPGADQHYRIDRADQPVSADPIPDATFRTLAAGPQDVTIAFGSCARTGSNSATFDAIRATEPDLFVHLGDLHYGNLTSPLPADHLHLLGRSLSTPAQSALFSSVPCAWVWDDHDYGPNDSDSSSPSREAALRNYRNAVPDWNVDPDPTQPINQAFTIGRVRVVIIDTRSRRTDATMLGPEQEAWLIDELVESSRTHALVVWANPSPWNVADLPGTDQWGGYGEERRRIANAIAAANIENLVMISGDWHLAAIDDGTNTAYADDDSPGFPLIHAAPLDSPARPADSPFSHGAFHNPGQFGTIDVGDDGGTSVDVTLTSRLWSGEELGALRLNIAVP